MNSTSTLSLRVLTLYKALLRNIQSLQPAQQQYYKAHIKHHIEAHRDEIDPVKVDRIIQRAEQDGLWILNKYLTHPPTSIYSYSSRLIDS